MTEGVNMREETSTFIGTDNFTRVCASVDQSGRRKHSARKKSSSHKTELRLCFSNPQSKCFAGGAEFLHGEEGRKRN